MRELERIALSKRWFKPEERVKTASVSEVEPTSNLTENIMILCSALRAQGMSKQAMEIEQGFSLVRQAQVYDVSGETGEDVVSQAHPDGSHKLENVDSTEAVVETIVDQHMKALKMLEKKPTGKTSSRKIIEMVKVVLGQAKQPSKSDNLYLQVKNKLRIINTRVSYIYQQTKNQITFSYNIGQSAKEISELSVNPTEENLEKIKDILDEIEERLTPKWGIFGLEKGAFKLIEPILAEAKTKANEALQLITEYFEEKSKENFQTIHTKEETPQESPESTDVPKQTVNGNGTTAAFNAQLQAIQSMISEVSGLLQDPKLGANSQMKAWTNKFYTAMTNDFNTYQGYQANEEADGLVNLQALVVKYQGYLEKLKGWLK